MTLLAPSPTDDAHEATATVDSEQPVTVYQPTRSGMPPFRAYVADVWHRRAFVWHLARTQLKAENYESAAGQVWVLLNPMLMAFVYLFVRSILRGPSEDRGDVLSHLVMGVFFFRFAAAGLTGGASSVSQNRQMVLNTAFPRIIFPLASTIQGVVELLPTIGILFLVHWYLDQPLNANLAYLPVVVVLLIIFNFGISVFFAPLAVLYQDVKSTLPYVSRVWLFATPVMYAVADVEANNPKLLHYLRFNPLFPFFSSLERIFDGVPPHRRELVEAAAWALFFLVAGTYLFLRKERLFARRL